MEPLTMPYLTKTVEERIKLKEDLKKCVNPFVEKNCLERAKICLSELKSPLWKFLDYILDEKFKNYVFMCDTDLELSTISR